MPAVSVPNGNAAASDETVDLPLFDISQETPELGKAIVEAAAKWGFLWIAGSPKPEDGTATTTTRTYDLDEPTVDHLFDVSRRFFKEAPPEEKQACAIKHNRGYVGMHVENLDPSKHARGDFKQAFNLQGPDLATGEWNQPIPDTFQKEDAALRDFHTRCRNMATRLLRLIAMGLEIPDADWIARTHDNAPNTSRLLYYPALPPNSDYNPQADIGAGAHSDYGSITLLFTRPGQPGLELLKPNGDWAAVPVFPPNYHSATFPPVVVNIGDLLSYWTNGLLKSTIHRVVLSSPTKETNGVNGSTTNGHGSNGAGTDRYSIAIFVQPHEDTKLTPMPSPLVADRAESFRKEVIGHGGGVVNADGMKTLTSGDYLSARLKATYGNVYQREEK
ncbi:uncharacterized protein PV06_06509 [Exophiala oligosperma]|uniref:Fe2OG dioxygenase domain-containing protein n=1 Tax=Exophiala oligosperma TaxID=215243 RepID=A0A0D2BTW5_9EURO|nr:uncharacterized protein PV06_06509 [Exophiala oligosperma]KIW40897.1 hypothetical protein PV06_06509 [Exophiala oligosperma]